MKKKELKRRHWHQPTLHFSSQKNRNVQWCESKLEQDYLLYLEFDEEVARYQSQPLSFVYHNDKGLLSRYTPDVLVERVGGTLVFVEVKPFSRLNRHLRRHFSSLNLRIHGRYNVPLLVVTDDQFRTGLAIDNMRYLYTFRKMSLEKTVPPRLLAELPSRVQLGTLREIASEYGCPPSIPFLLMAHGIMDFDMTKPLQDELQLERRQ